MVRLVIYLLTIALFAVGLSWLADRPGTMQITWQGYDIETSVFQAVVILAALVAIAVFLWSLVRTIWNSPAALGQRIIRRREKRGLDAISSGLIAVGSGDSTLAGRYALLARKSLPHEPLTHLLRAQAAELSGDRATARRIYEAMLTSPETKQLGLRGLYLEARREDAGEAARQFAEKAHQSNPKLGWSSDALFELQCKEKDWAGALATLAESKKSGRMPKPEADRKRAVLLTADAVELEETDADKALAMALEAHQLAPDLVPAAVVAGRILAARGQTAKVAKVLQKTWARAPHPEIATIYAHARIGDSTRDRLDRVRQLAALSPHSIESSIAVATTALEAHLYDEARAALAPLTTGRLTQRVAKLMARIEAGDEGTQGHVREWLARAVTAAPDPAWIADGVISDHWQPLSPVTQRLDAFEWRVPVDTRDAGSAAIDAEQIEQLLALSGPAADDNVVTAVTVPLEEAAPEVVVTAEEIEPEAEAKVAAAETGAETEVTAEPPVEVAEVVVDAAPESADAKHADSDSTGRDATVAAPEAPKQKPPITEAEVTVRPTNGKNRAADPKAETGQAEIYMSQRAPDDPGTDDLEPELEQPVARRSYRASR